MQRVVLLFGLLAVGTGGAWAGAKETHRVAGTAMMESSVCGGGAAISREQLQRLPPPRPLRGKEFLVVAGERISAKHPEARFITRADGTFVTRLPPGTWCIFEASRKADSDPPEPVPGPSPGVDGSGIDQACLAQYRRRCDLVLPLKSDVRSAQIVFVERCPQPWAQPCYHGPMPP